MLTVGHLLCIQGGDEGPQRLQGGQLHPARHIPGEALTQGEQLHAAHGRVRHPRDVRKHLQGGEADERSPQRAAWLERWQARVSMWCGT